MQMVLAGFGMTTGLMFFFFLFRCLFLLFQANDTLSFLLAIIFHNIVSLSLCVMMTPRIGPTPLLHPWRAPTTVFINKETFFVITSLFPCCYYPPLQPASSLTTIAQLFRTDFPLAYWGFSFFLFSFFSTPPSPDYCAASLKESL